MPHTNYAWQGIIRLIKTTNRIRHRPLFCADQLGADVLRPRSGPARSKRCFCLALHAKSPNTLFCIWGGRRVCSVDSNAEAGCPQGASTGAAVITIEPHGVPDTMLSMLPPPPSCVPDPFLCGVNKETSLFMLNSWSMLPKRQSEHLQLALE